MLFFYPMFFIYLIKKAIWPKEIRQDERIKAEGKNLFGLGERSLNQFNFEKFEAQRDKYIKNIEG
jgi:hypothetical protein